MSLFRCDECGCVENTALGRYWTRNDADMWSDDNLGEALCSQCAPMHFKTGEPTDYSHQWHGMFPKERASKEDYPDLINVEDE